MKGTWSRKAEIDEWLAANGLDPLATPDGDAFEVHPWHDLYLHAFDALRYDRFYGAFGGETPITYLALSQFCRDYAIEDEDRTRFMIFINAIDAEYLSMLAEDAKKQKEQT